MTWTVFYVVLVAAGFGLPALADHLSRVRDDSLAQRIAARTPETVMVRFGSSTYACDWVPASTPTYECAVEVP